MSQRLVLFNELADFYISSHPRLKLLRNIIFFVVVVRYGGRFIYALYDLGLVRICKDLRTSLFLNFFTYLKRIPWVKAKINTEMGKMLGDMRKSIIQKHDGVPAYTHLPPKPLSTDEILEQLALLEKSGHTHWEDGKVSGTVYHGGKELVEVSSKAYELFIWSNPLHADVFPGVRKMEADIISMVVAMYNGGSEACGTTTSGGTESILMAVKAYREWGREEKGITQPEIVVADSAHCAFDKAAHYFGMKLIHVPVEKESRKADLRAMRKAVTSNTVAIAGSCPSYPHGVMDDIQGLARIAREYGIGLHVDCCLGGFLVPFMAKAGYDLPPFDFRVPGVTSISCDTHKYGFAPKGSSVVLYANKALRSHQYFVAPNWPGGVYASPTIAGSRAGALLAGCWATMLRVGEEGYVDATRQIIAAARTIADGIRKIPGLKLMGQPEVCVVAFASDYFDIFKLSEALSKRGWNLNNLQYPSSVHICVTYANKDSAQTFINDLTELTREIMKNPGAKATGSAVIYGLAQAIPDRSIIDRMARSYIDVLFENDAPSTST